MDIDRLISEVIPPSDYKHRNGFSNISIIDKLTNSERQNLDTALIEKLSAESEKDLDALVVETLGYLKSINSLPTLYDLVTKKSGETQLIIASSIFEINQDMTMIDVALIAAKAIDNEKDSYYVYKLIPSFYYLAKFENAKTNQFIKSYTSHPEYLISYNAKRALGSAPTF